MSGRGKMGAKKMIKASFRLAVTPGKRLLPYSTQPSGSAVGYNEGTIFGLLHLIKRL